VVGGWWSDTLFIIVRTGDSGWVLCDVTMTSSSSRQVGGQTGIIIILSLEDAPRPWE